MADAHFPGALVGCERAGKIIQRNQAHRHVVERHRQPLGIAKRQQHFVGPFITSQSFLETVLPVVNISDIDLHMRPAFVVAQIAKDFLGVLRGRKCLIVFPQ